MPAARLEKPRADARPRKRAGRASGASGQPAARTYRRSTKPSDPTGRPSTLTWSARHEPPERDDCPPGGAWLSSPSRGATHRSPDRGGQCRARAATGASNRPHSLRASRQRRPPPVREPLTFRGRSSGPLLGSACHPRRPARRAFAGRRAASSVRPSGLASRYVACGLARHLARPPAARRPARPQRRVAAGWSAGGRYRRRWQSQSAAIQHAAGHAGARRLRQPADRPRRLTPAAPRPRRPAAPAPAPAGAGRQPAGALDTRGRDRLRRRGPPRRHAAGRCRTWSSAPGACGFSGTGSPSRSGRSTLDAEPAVAIGRRPSDPRTRRRRRPAAPAPAAPAARTGSLVIESRPTGATHACSTVARSAPRR